MQQFFLHPKSKQNKTKNEILEIENNNNNDFQYENFVFREHHQKLDKVLFCQKINIEFMSKDNKKNSLMIIIIININDVCKAATAVAASS